MKLRSLALTALPFLVVASVAHAEGGVSRRHVEPSAERVTGGPVATASDAELESSALSFLSSRPDALGLQGVALSPRKVSGVGAARKVVRFAQMHDGVPVVSGGVSIAVEADGRQGVIAVDVDRSLDIDVVPSLLEDEARQSLVDVIGTETSASGRLVVMRAGSHGKRGTLAWVFDVSDAPGGTRYFVDAHSGVVVQARPLATHALGRVHEMNIVETPNLVDLPLPLLDETTQPVRLRGWDGLFNVTNYVSGSSQQGNYVLEQTVGPNVGADFLYDLPAQLASPNDELAQVNLYFHITHMRQAFENLGVDQTSPNWSLTAVANGRENGQPLNNAFFSQQGVGGDFAANNLIVIGQGQVDFAYDSDVFKHEFGHYVTHNAIDYNLGQAHFDDLGLSPWSGAIDEGIADYFACSDNDDAELGEGALGGSIRDLTDTSKSCPGDVVGEVHADGEIIGSTGWSIREVVGREVADQIVWGALSTLNPGADFLDFANGIKSASDAALEAGSIDAADRAAIDQILTDRGLDTCERVISLDGGAMVSGFVFGLDLLAQGFGVQCEDLQDFGLALPSLFHYSFQPAASDIGVRFSLEGSAQGPGDLDYSIFVRVGEPVEFDVSPQGIPEVDDFDYRFDSNDADAEAVIDASSDPAFDPSERYFAVIVVRGCPSLEFEITAGPAEPPVMGTGGSGGEGGNGGAGASGGSGGTGGEGGDPTGDDPDDGCDCRSASSGTNNALGFGLAFVGLGLAARRRIRRR